MKAVILAGGLGTRISEESHLKPKPMIEIGGFPVLWHIMKIYDAHGIRDFVICCGYKGYLIKEYFANYFLHTSDITIDLANNDMEIRRMSGEPWKVTLVDTGRNTQTGGRLKRISDYVDSRFCLTYGDGVSDIDIKALIDSHDQNKTLATVTAVQPAARFGGLQIEGTLATKFHEKPSGDGFWVSGGFFVCETEVLNRIDGDATVFEKDPLENLARDNELSVYKHHGFWAAMDTLRDRIYLEELWAEKKAPWKVWE